MPPCFRWMFALLVLALGATTEAQESPPPRTLLVLADPEGQLAERIRGQMADTGWQLRFAIDAPPPGPGETDAARLHMLADTHDARSLVWLTRLDGGGLRIDVWDRRGRSWLARELPAPEPDRWGRSAQDEAAALVVRSSVLALAEASAPAPTPPPAPRDPPARRAPPQQPAAAPAEPTSPTWLIAFGWELGADGLGPTLHHAPRLLLGVGLGPWAVRLGGAWGLASETEDAVARLRLQRQRLRVQLDRELLRAGTLTLEAGVSAGVWRMARETLDVREGWQATPAQQAWSPLLGGQLGLVWPATRSGVRLTLIVGLDVLPRTPRLRYATAGGTEDHGQGWRILPRAGLLLGWQLSP